QWAQRLLIVFPVVAMFVAFAPFFRRARSDAELAAKKPWNLPVRFAVAVVLTGVTALLMWSISPAPWGLTAYGRFMATYGDRLAAKVVAENNVPSRDSETRSPEPDIFCVYQGEGLNGSV